MTFKFISSLILILFLANQINCQCDYLRTARILVNSKVGKLTLKNQYITEGMIQSIFQPVLIPKGALGQGYYSNQVGTSTGTNGYVRLQISDQQRFLIVLFEQTWDTAQVAAICLQDGVDKLNSDDKAFYNSLLTALQTKESLGYTATNKLYCSSNNFQINELTSLKLSGAGHSASLQGQMTTEPSTQYDLEECRYMQILVTLES